MSKKTVALSILVLFLPMLCGILLWNRLPAQIATHFDINGTPNGYSSKAFTVFTFPLIMVLIQFACILATKADKRTQSLNGKIKNIVLWICPVIAIAVFVCIYSRALGYGLNISVTLGALLGLEFLIIGNYLPKCRQNNVVGIRVPWTLNDEEVWDKTHRLAGKIMVVFGLAVLLNALLNVWSFWISVAIIITGCVIPVIYSGVLYHKKKQS
ncbi:MAG: SdpI family protein [Firmicutes bacterium]|nr:SdpI family protein [Bacillota bacterium]